MLVPGEEGSAAAAVVRQADKNAAERHAVLTIVRFPCCIFHPWFCTRLLAESTFGSHRFNGENGDPFCEVNSLQGDGNSIRSRRRRAEIVTGNRGQPWPATMRCIH